MFEADMADAGMLKKLLDSIKELVTDANFECNEEGLKLQAMDNSHVALVSVQLTKDGFSKFRCDRPMPLGVNLASLTKVLKCAKDNDQVKLTAGDSADILKLRFSDKAQARVSNYEMKLMDIDMDELGIPETEYDATITMSASEFGRIVRDLSNLGESVRVEVSKEGIRFSADGEAANGSVLLKQTDNARKSFAKSKGGSSSKANGKVKKEDDDDNMDEDKEEDDGGNFKGREEEEDEADKEEEEEEEEEEVGKKRKKSSSSSKPSKKAKKGEDSDGPDDGVMIEMTQAVALTFSLKYLVTFSKSAALSGRVELRMSNEVPLLVAYDFGQGHIHYYLAPKIGDNE
ncbi:proliferating cell nuclear antigen, N-terminal domain-containing protein [Auriculariales sp. MPI-PUGE-AT-0066]|nr:proliferating cell nuclear antigen, N-terminal domain-containing protein [Auriculariales sp. MPI-PUGE-AT-0066]